MLRIGSRHLHIGITCALLLCGWCATRAFAADAARPVRFRLEWGGGAARLWSGVIESESGRFAAPKSLGVEADDPGTLRVDGDSIWLQRRSTRVYDGFDVTWIGGGDSTITVTLQSAGTDAPGNTGPDRWRFEVVPADLNAQPRVFTLANSDTRLSVRRTPGDVLCIQTERPHLIFEPGERLLATVALNTSPTPRQVDATLDWKISPARSNSTLQSGSHAISLPPDGFEVATTSLDILLPEQEGVYDVRLTLSGRGVRTETGTLQLVVLSPEPLLPFDTGADDRIVDVFEPSRPGLFRRVERRSALRSINQPLGRLLGIDPRPAAFADVEPSEPKIEWNAYKLRLKHPEQPHRLVVSLPKEKDRARSLGISLLEPNAAGQLTPLGLDSGVSVRGDALQSAAEGPAPEEAKFITHDILFWPKTKEPILMLHDMGTGNQLDVGRIKRSSSAR
jgi:hypothetical protein